MDADSPQIDRLLELGSVAAITAAATAFAMLADGVLGFSPLVPLAGAVIASLALTGRRGAAVCVVLATLCTDFMFLPPRYHWTLNGTVLVLAGYYVAAALGAVVVNRRHRGWL